MYIDDATQLSLAPVLPIHPPCLPAAAAAAAAARPISHFLLAVCLSPSVREVLRLESCRRDITAVNPRENRGNGDFLCEITAVISSGMGTALTGIPR